MTNIITILIKVLLPFIWTFIQINLDTEIVLYFSRVADISGIDLMIDLLDSYDYAEILLNAETGSMVWGLLLVFLSPLCFFMLVFFLNARNAQGEMILTGTNETASSESRDSNIHMESNSNEMVQVSFNSPKAPSSILNISSGHILPTERN